MNISQKKYPYGHQNITEDDIACVAEALRADFITSGPVVESFERAICEYTGAKFCVALSNATAGLHLAAMAAGLKEGDEAITSPITFLSSANCARFCGATVVFADIDPATANISVSEIEKKITEKTKLIVPVHFAGQSCDMRRIREIAAERSITVIEDAAHAIGSDYLGTKVGSCEYSDMTVFSFHPVKTITTGEGGAITTNDESLYKRLKALRSHGVYKEGEMARDWRYEMRELGFNYRMTELQAALGVSQMKRLGAFKARRREIVKFYNERLGLPHLREEEFSNACFHLYPVLLENRAEVYRKARERGLFLQVHYIPVYSQPYYRSLGLYDPRDYPNAEEYYRKTISLPLYPALTDADLEEIARRLGEIL